MCNCIATVGCVATAPYMARNTRETTCPATLAVLTWILKRDTLTN